MVSRPTWWALLCLPLAGCLDISAYAPCVQADCAEGQVCSAGGCVHQVDSGPSADVGMLDGARGSLDLAGPGADQGPPDDALPQPVAGDAAMDMAPPLVQDMSVPPEERVFSTRFCARRDAPACWHNGTEQVPSLTRGTDPGDLESDGRVYQVQGPEGMASAKFGEGGVALGGNFGVVGAPGGRSVRGAAYVFRIARNGAPVAITSLVPDDFPLHELSSYGKTVAAHGDTLWVGAPDAKGKAGAVFRYIRVEEERTLDGVEEPPAGTKKFGAAIAAWGNIALVGAPGDMGEQGGRAFLFRRGGDGWGRTVIENPVPGDMRGRFGAAVALGPDWAAVGAPKADGQGGSSEKGAAYALRHRGVAVPALTRVWNPDDAVSQGFGGSLALSFGRLAVGGTPGRVHLYDLETLRDGCAGMVLDPEEESGFGATLAMEGGALFVSDESEAGRLQQYGRVHNAARWVWNETIEQEQINAAVNGNDSREFGRALSVFGGRVLVVGERGRGPMARPVVYLFTYAGPLCDRDGRCKCVEGADFVGPSCMEDGIARVTGVKLLGGPEQPALLCHIGANHTIDESEVDNVRLRLRFETTDSVTGIESRWVRQNPETVNDNVAPFEYPGGEQRWGLVADEEEVLELEVMGQSSDDAELALRIRGL